MGGGVFVKKVDLSPQNETKLNQTLLCNFAGLIFYFLHFTYLVSAYAPIRTPPACGHVHRRGAGVWYRWTT